MSGKLDYSKETHLLELTCNVLLSDAYICTNAQGYFFQLLTTNGIVPRIEEQGIEGTLRYTREAAYSYVIRHCPSFRNDNCCAQFSEIFSSSLLETLTTWEIMIPNFLCAIRNMSIL